MPDHLPRIGDLSLAARLRRELEGEVLFDPVSRGLYSTDASIYQIEPVGVVVPRTVQDVATAIEIAVQEGVPVLPRGAGTSQGGQAVGRALVIDTSKHLRAISGLDAEAGTVRVEPGVVLDDLNRWLAPHGLFFPVDVATSSRATLGGMAGNNSSGARSIRYGIMADQVRAIDAVLADGTALRFGELPEGWLEDGGPAETGGAQVERTEARAWSSRAACGRSAPAKRTNWRGGCHRFSGTSPATTCIAWSSPG